MFLQSPASPICSFFLKPVIEFMDYYPSISILESDCQGPERILLTFYLESLEL